MLKLLRLFSISLFIWASSGLLFNSHLYAQMGTVVTKALPVKLAPKKAVVEKKLPKALASNKITASKEKSKKNIPIKDAPKEGIPKQFQANLAIAKNLLKANANLSALHFLQIHPPTVSVVAAWEAWAELKWQILIQLKDWQLLKEDTKGLIASFGGAKYFSIPYYARALTELGEFDAARRVLQPALLLEDLPLRLRKGIRAQLIYLYQSQEDFSNAKIEAVRFHDEFDLQDITWFLQRSVIEYLAGDIKSAGQLLAPIASIEAKLLQTLFRFKGKDITAKQATASIKHQIERKRITNNERKLAWGILASLSVGDEQEKVVSRIQNLEKYLVIDSSDLYPQVVAHTLVDLKKAYLDLSNSMINDALLDATALQLKLTLAERSEQSGALINARALYVDLMLNKRDAVLAVKAKSNFVSSLIRTKQFLLLTHLVGDEKLLTDFSALDGNHSSAILNYALAEGDVALISKIAPFLSEAPETVDAHEWILQKARIDIFSGRFKEGKAKIIRWLGEENVLQGGQVDRVLQPVFDLQAIGEDELGLQLLDLIYRKTQSKRHRREILFWKAQSYQALDDRQTAAEYYLRSAMVQDNGYDQWGQSARFHAASNLMEVGVHDDARQIFEGLLKAATTDAPRRGTIKQSLQRLWLLENKSTQTLR